MLGVLYLKMHIGVIRPRIRVRNEISRFLEILEFEYFPFGFFGSDPGFEQLSATAAQSIFQIQKRQTGSTRTQEFQESRNLIFDPNFWPYDPNRDFFFFFSNIVHKCPI